MRFAVVDPMQQLRTTYDGSAVYLTEPAQMADPRIAFRTTVKKVRLTSCTSRGPAYGSSGANHTVTDPEKEFAKAHYEQHMKVRARSRSTGRRRRSTASAA